MENKYRKGYFKSYANIAREALLAMNELWELIESENGEPFAEVFDYYPCEKSFDEFVTEFSFWVLNWNFKI